MLRVRASRNQYKYPWVYQTVGNLGEGLRDPWLPYLAISAKSAKGPWPNNLVRKKALEQQIWNEIESSHFAFPLHTQPGCYITVPSCSARVTLKEHIPRAISPARQALGNVHCDVPLTKIMFALCSNIMFISCLYCPKVYVYFAKRMRQPMPNKCIFNQETEQSILNSLYIDLT